MEKDKNFQSILSRRVEKKPSDGLEDRIMLQVKTTAKIEKSTDHYLSLSWMFLFLGLVLILAFSLAGMKTNTFFYSFESFDFKSLIQIVGVTAILLLFENLYRKNLEFKNK